MSTRVRVLCPRCKVDMDYISETVKSNSGIKQLFRYYRCPACSYRLLDEKLSVNVNGESLIIVFSMGSKRLLVIENL
ncbi:MAG: hypothetical protein QXJ65_04720 [Acidilobaceae archaeon]